MENSKANTKDILTETEQQFFDMGFNHCLGQFNQKITSDWFNNELNKQETETSEKYEARLRDLCVELMCSNRGFASCLDK